MNRFPPWRRAVLAAAPVFAALALILNPWRGFGTGDGVDSLLGVIVGIGVGLSLVAVFGLRRRC